MVRNCLESSGKHKPKKVKYEEMFPFEFKKALKNNPTAYLPIGSLEWHGYHNALGLDSLKAWKILELVAQKIGGIVFPPLFLGVDTDPGLNINKYPNKGYDCYHLDEKLLEKVLESYFERMIHIGFKTIFVLAGHYPNSKVAHSVAEKFRDADIKIIVGAEYDFVENQKGDHAGKWETSLFMATFPHLVDLKLMAGKKNRLLAVTGDDPQESAKEYGKEMLYKIICGIIKTLDKKVK
ncbi:MAG: creatininase family protein [Nanoarchaeota archaeon]|nr:creatininase family protein [Nanoarchaeota archaeon]MBU1321021.1 creatininase family protein [Nanoarchaeota archaeon]MBU1597510.1 creatininase family protein [Nanoarchaeota archaeon]